MPCPHCGGPNLTPPGDLMTGHGNVTVRWKLSGESGWFSSTASTRATRVVVCADCGYFLLFARPEDLDEVRTRLAQLTTPG